MKIIISAFSSLTTDQRIEKICHTLYDEGYEIHLIGCDWKGKEKIERPYPTEKIRLYSKSLKTAYPEFNFKLYQKLKAFKNEKIILYCNDLDALCANYIYSKKYNIPLIFDSHEIFTEMPAIQGKISQKIWRWIEQNFLPNIKYFLTASNSYANWFAQKYNIPHPVVLQNFPYRHSIINEEKKENHLEKIILYQGASNPSRGVDKLFYALHLIPNTILKIAGDGPEKENWQKLTKKLNLEKKVFFLGKITPNELRKITPTADVGISIEENNGLSYYYSLPNKIADYIQAEIPVVTSNFPEMKKIVQNYHIGECIENHSPKELAKKINRVLENGKQYYKKQLKEAGNHICWENEAPKLIQIVKKVENENFN